MEYFTAALYVAVCILILTKYSTIIKLVQRQLHLYKLASKFKGPPGLPIIGHAHLFIGNTEENTTTAYKLIESYPSPCPLWLGHLHVFFALSTPEQIKVACLSSKTVEKSMLYDFAQDLFGSGLLTATAAKWRVHRRLIAPFFRTKISQSFVKVFASQATEMAVRMEQNLNGPELQLSHYLFQYSLTAICETTMDVNLNASEIDFQKYAEAFESALEIFIRRAARPWIYPNFIFHRTQLGQDNRKAVKLIHNFAECVIQEKKKEIHERSNQPNFYPNENDISFSMPQRQLFLDHFPNASDDSIALSDKVHDEVNMLILAGSDTTAATSEFVMLMLASHPDVQEKIYEELCEIHGGHDGDDLNITEGNLKRMTYLERVIKETMRLFPIGPYIARSVTEDLSIGEHIIPKGSQVAFAILNVHRNEKYWPDPMKFDPDRFLPEEIAKRHPYTYLAFSAGIRNCVGAKYAMLSMKTLIATVIWKYVLKKDNIVPVQDIRLKMELLLRPVNPISLGIEKRMRKYAFV